MCFESNCCLYFDCTMLALSPGISVKQGNRLEAAHMASKERLWLCSTRMLLRCSRSPCWIHSRFPHFPSAYKATRPARGDNELKRTCGTPPPPACSLFPLALVCPSCPSPVLLLILVIILEMACCVSQVWHSVCARLGPQL